MKVRPHFGRASVIADVGRNTLPLLDDASYRSAIGKKMVRVAASGDAPLPFWSYGDAIPKEDYQGYDCSDGTVLWVWRDETGRFEHILIDTKEDRDVCMVVV